MQDGEAGRSHLIRQFTQVKAQVARLRANVEAKQKKVAELGGKLSLAEEVRRLCTEATAAIPELTKTVTTLERTLAKVDALAATENSRNNSTPEVRAINQQIEKALEDVHKAERKASQYQMDCNALEHDIEEIRLEFEDGKAAKSRGLEDINHAIQEIRKNISKARKANLDTLLEKQEKLANAEVENQMLVTQVMFYKQMIASVTAELEALKMEKGIDVINAEISKFNLAINDIPVHNEGVGQNIAQARDRCTNLRNEIYAIEDEISNSNEKMSKAESDQDQLSHDIQEAEGKGSELRSARSSAEALTQELERELRNIQKKEATNAQDEERELQREISDFQARIDRAKKKLDALNGDAGTTRPAAMEHILTQIENEQKEIVRRARELDDEITSLHEQNALRS